MKYCFALDLKGNEKGIDEYIKHQQKLPFATSGEKWVLMDKIFDLKDY